MKYILYQDGYGMTSVTLKVIDDQFIKASPGYLIGEIKEILNLGINDVWIAENGHFKLFRIE